MRRIPFLLLVVGIIIGLCGCVNYERLAKDIMETEAETQTNEPTQAETTAKTEAPTQAETISDVPVYYEDNESINLYIVRFNECNPDYPIAADELKKSKHHGSEHDDQVEFIRDGYLITVSGFGFGLNKAEVYIEHLGNSSTSSDEYGEMFVRFAKPYNSELTDEDLHGYWQQVVDDSTNTTKFDDFECTKNSSPNIVYFKLSGKIK